ncbi:MAG: RNase H family protein [Gammaproteobacteria bacterium]
MGAKIVENALVIYTDGSLFRGRRGGYGMLFIHFDALGAPTVLLEHNPPGATGTTINRMELKAVIEALELAPEQSCYAAVDRVIIRTDSAYVASNCYGPLMNWSKNQWRDARNRPIENVDLWKNYIRARNKIRKRIEIAKVKGHGKRHEKDPLQDRADKLARESAQSPLSAVEFHESTRKKKGTEQTRRGNITVNGTEVAIYVVSTKRLRPQNEWRYRYQIMKEDVVQSARFYLQ